MARTKKDPMLSSRHKPTPCEPMPTDGVNATSILEEQAKKYGWRLMDASLRFRDAHMELRILVRADVETGTSWVTAADAQAIIDHVEAHASNPCPPITKWM